MCNMKEKLMHKYALSSQGAKDMIKAFISVTISDLILMIPVSLLYFLVKDYMEGNLAGRGGFYIAGVIITLVLIAISTYIQYNATFLSTYVESGVRRITLAEKLRKIPLSFFGKKDLSDLTSTIMADCAQMETASSHFIPELVGACISTAFVAIGLFFFDWRMAIAALWVLPISFIIVSCSGKVQRKLLEAARLAPSAMNRQPWRFVSSEDRIHLFVKKPGKIGYQMQQDFNLFDAGVALSHMLVTAEEQWFDLEYQKLDSILEKEFQNYVYVGSLLIFNDSEKI